MIGAVDTGRTEMDTALKRMVTSALRPRGFSGSLPHLRRISSEQIDLISFQHHSAGGSFVVEIAVCGPDGLTTSWGKSIEPKKVKATDVNPPRRPRLGSPTFPIGEHWFTYGPRSHEVGASHRYPAAHYEKLAGEVARLVVEQGERYWATTSPPP